MENKNQEIKCPKEWVIERLREHELDYDYKTDALKKGDLIVEEALTISFLRLDARHLDVEEIRSYIKDALAVYRHERSQVELNLLVDQLSFVSTDSDPISEWVTAVRKKSSTLDTIVMKHFIWQVKRKLAGLPVEQHMMPVLFGRSGAGKSVAVSRLIEPLRSVALQTSMSIFSDPFSRRAFARNFLVFFDELQGSDNTDVNTMKQIITAPVIEWRAMRSERVMSAPQNSTFIGCSNDPVCDRIKDPTSSRRFWQINCADQMDWQAINSIDYLALWRSVDENAPAPVLEHLSDIRKIQEAEIRVKDSVEQWLEEVCEVVSFDESSLTTSELYESFKNFCLSQNQKSFPQFQKFARDLKRIFDGDGHGLVSKKTNRGTTWAIRIRTSEAVSVVVGSSDGSDGQLAFDFKAA
jgi:hypothetical protein